MTVVVDRLVVAVNAHDLDAVADLIREDYRSEQPAHPGRAFAGRAQMLANWAAMFAGSPTFTRRSAGRSRTVTRPGPSGAGRASAATGWPLRCAGDAVRGHRRSGCRLGGCVWRTSSGTLPVSSRPWRACPVTGRGPRTSRTAQRSPPATDNRRASRPFLRPPREEPFVLGGCERGGGCAGSA